MPNDVPSLLQWAKVLLIIASVSSTLFPALYLFAPWYRSQLGRALMLQSVAFALAVDLTALFQFWQTDNLMLLLWINVTVFLFITAATTYLAAMLVQYNFHSHKEKVRNVDV